MYKYDVHVHTMETSPCGKVRGAEVVKLYKKMGYDGIVITDHYSDRFFMSVAGQKWETKMEKFLAGYREAFRAGSEIGLNVLLGMEINFRWSLNDYLVYGIDEDFLLENPFLHKKGLKSFRRLADKYGYLVYQAHPFRIGMTRADPDCWTVWRFSTAIRGIIQRMKVRRNSRWKTGSEWFPALTSTCSGMPETEG